MPPSLSISLHIRCLPGHSSSTFPLTLGIDLSQLRNELSLLNTSHREYKQFLLCKYRQSLFFFLVNTSKIWRATKVFPQPAIPPKYTLCPLLTRSKIICCCSLRLQAALYKKEKKHAISDTKNSLHQLVFSEEKHDKVYNYIDNFIS